MKIVVSWSSGKDSAWTLHVLRQNHPGTIAGLLSTMNGEFDRVAMHAVRREVLERQAKAAGLPLTTVVLPWPCSNAEYEARMQEVIAKLEREGVTHVAFGDLFLQDVREYRERQLARTALQPLFPLWGVPTHALAREMIAGGLRATITCIDPAKLPASFAGREFDAALLAELPPSADPCGENGEFHTCVWDGPMFSAPLALAPGEIVTRDAFVFADLACTPNVSSV